MDIKVPNPLARRHPDVDEAQGSAGPVGGVRAWFFVSFWGLPSGPVGWVGARLLPLVAGRFYRLVAEELALQPDDELLEVGCGSGGLLALATQPRHVAGLDASGIQLGLARGRLADRLAAGTAELVLGDAMALPWDDDRFSAVACVNTLKFVPDPARALREIVRVLRPGGRALVVIDPPPKDPAQSGAYDAFGERLWTAEDAEALMAGAGFAEVTVTQLPAKQLRMQLLRGVKASAAQPPGQRT
ncbi:MAG TPA: methyltransferase domain-containing protein [Candidatus Nanopelagicales bacterium]